MKFANTEIELFNMKKLLNDSNELSITLKQDHDRDTQIQTNREWIERNDKLRREWKDIKQRIA